MKRFGSTLKSLWQEVDGAVFVEYLLLLTIVGIGVIVGLSVVRDALVDELRDLAQAIMAIVP